MIVRPASRIERAISFGVLLALRPLDQRDHPVQEGLAGVGGDLDLEPVAR